MLESLLLLTLLNCFPLPEGFSERTHPSYTFFKVSNHALVNAVPPSHPASMLVFTERSRVGRQVIELSPDASDKSDHAFQYTPPQPAGTWGYGVPPAVRMSGQMAGSEAGSEALLDGSPSLVSLGLERPNTAPDSRPCCDLVRGVLIHASSAVDESSTQVESADSRSSRLDLGLGVISLSAAMVATGLTASCLAAKTCEEQVPITRWAFDRGPVWGVVGRAGVNGLIHYAVARWIPKGKWRTATLATLAVINVTNAVLDTRTLMEIERQKQ